MKKEIEQLIKQLEKDIKTLKEKKWEMLPKSQTIFNNEQEWENAKKNIITKWETEINNLKECN